LGERCALEQQAVEVGVGPVYSSFTDLVNMVAQGWQIEPPVYVRPRWRSRLRLKQENTYHFGVGTRSVWSMYSIVLRSSSSWWMVR